MNRREGAGTGGILRTMVMAHGSAGFALGVLVALVTAGSFLVPSEWFLFLNPARTEISTLDTRQAKLMDDLAAAQEKHRQAEQEVILAQLALDRHQNTLMQLVRRQLADGVNDPFEKGPSLNEIIERFRFESRMILEDGPMPVENEASTLLMDQISEARSRLADFAKQNKSRYWITFAFRPSLESIPLIPIDLLTPSV